MTKLFVRTAGAHLFLSAACVLAAFIALRDSTNTSLETWIYLILVLAGVNLAVTYRLSRFIGDPLREMLRRLKSFPAGRSSLMRLPTYREADELRSNLNDFLVRTARDLDELQLEKELLTALLEGLREGVLCLNKEARVVYQNRALHRDLVHSNAAGKPYFEAIKNGDLLQYVHGMVGPYDRTNSAEQENGAFDLKLGQRFFRVNAHPVVLRDEPQLYLILVRDETQQYNTRRLREDFLQNASHELKTPVTSIRGYGETLLARETRSQQHSFLEGILRNVERMERIIEDMVTISSLESRSFPFNPEAITLKRYMQNIHKLVSGTLKRRNQVLEIQVPDNLELRADPLLMEHLLINLIANAARHSDEEATIHVQVESDGRHRILFAVADSGPGVPPDLRSKIFERFYRVDKNRSRDEGGTGLGLSIVRQITHLHGGRVWVEDNPGGGAIFKVLLPDG